MWGPGDRLRHRENPGLGPGRILAVSGRAVDVEFPSTGTRLRLAADSPALVPLDFRAGQRVRRMPSGIEALVDRVLDGDRALLTDGTEASLDELWPVDEHEVLERLAAADVDPAEDFALRLDSLHLAQAREAEGLGSFLGGRIRLFPHQLHVAERATRMDPVRWLLADEVGLGKTVEACLILNHLVRTRGVERCLVVAPATLTIQWLGELWRKYHQVFVVLDEDRLADVTRDFGAAFNPFDAHRRVVTSLEMMVAEPRMTRWAVEAGIDLLVVDEAHHLRRPRGHPGEPAYRAIEPITRLGRHALLLTATPLEDDARAFFRLLQLLRPGEFGSEEEFERRLATEEPLPPCTSSTRRTDIGGLPPRRPLPVDLEDEAGWAPRLELEALLREEAASGDLLARKRAVSRLQRALGSGASLLAVLPPDATELRRLAEAADAVDPRLSWLAEHAPAWKESGEKTLVFVADMETLELLRTELSRRAQLATAVFHEDLSPPRRDIEVARFRLPSGPSLIVSTEAGGEGRNFEFCHRLILFDLPWNPVTVEQRIGRLDRIGRTRDVEIVYFPPPSGLGAGVARAYEDVGLFREPLAALEPQLATLKDAIERAALEPVASDALVGGALEEARAARERVRVAAGQQLHREPFRADMAGRILARVPAGLDALTEDVVVTAAERLGLRVDEKRGPRTWAIELGNEALVDHLPGVSGGASFLGTFDREAAVADESIDFFAGGHPLVEGILAHLEESSIGRAAVLELAPGSERGFGLLALYRDDGPGFTATAVDETGAVRPDWVRALMARPLRARAAPMDEVGGPGWRERIRRLAAALDGEKQPVAVAAMMVEPAAVRER
jgi:ATP-dependent helicase HepA